MKMRRRWLKKLVWAQGILCLRRDNNIEDSFIALFFLLFHFKREEGGVKLHPNALRHKILVLRMTMIIFFLFSSFFVDRSTKPSRVASPLSATKVDLQSLIEISPSYASSDTTKWREIIFVFADESLESLQIFFTLRKDLLRHKILCSLFEWLRSKNKTTLIAYLYKQKTCNWIFHRREQLREGNWSEFIEL